MDVCFIPIWSKAETEQSPQKVILSLKKEIKNENFIFFNISECFGYTIFANIAERIAKICQNLLLRRALV